jgi:hypothetical protein
MDTTGQTNYINGPCRADHGLELHTLVHGMDYLVLLWWKVWLVGGRKDSGAKAGVIEVMCKQMSRVCLHS